jgi:hypothetical protein
LARIELKVGFEDGRRAAMRAFWFSVIAALAISVAAAAILDRIDVSTTQKNATANVRL